MNTQTLIISVTAVIILLVAAIGVWAALRSQRTQNLRKKYGPEYDYTMETLGDRDSAEKSLKEREKRVNQLEIRNLDPQQSDQFHAKWVAIQANFVDEPLKSVEQASDLIDEVMAARGFPTTDFEQRAADISVNYPDLVTNYRNAHEISVKGRQDGISTEDLRSAMVSYRSLFEELLLGEPIKESR